MAVAAGMFEGPDPRRSAAAVLSAIRGARRAAIDRSGEMIDEIEAGRDSEIKWLDGIEEVVLAGGQADPDPGEGTVLATAGTAQSAKRKRRARRLASPAQLLRRREAIVRCLSEQGEPMALGKIRQTLGLSAAMAQSAVSRLLEEGEIVRTGTGSATRYGLKSTPDRQRRVADSAGTPEQRLLGLLRDRGSASLNELAQALREPRDAIERLCGALVGERKIRMGRRNGTSVYISLGAV